MRAADLKAFEHTLKSTTKRQFDVEYQQLGETVKAEVVKKVCFGLPYVPFLHADVFRRCKRARRKPPLKPSV